MAIILITMVKFNVAAGQKEESGYKNMLVKSETNINKKSYSCDKRGNIPLLILLTEKIVSDKSNDNLTGDDNKISLVNIIHISIILILILLYIGIYYIFKRKLKVITKSLTSKNEQLAIAIKAGDIRVWGYDLKTDLLYNIEGWCVPDGEFHFDDLWQVIHEEDLERFKNKMKDVLNGDQSGNSIIVRVKYPDCDDVCYVEKELMPCYNSSGEIIGLIGTHKDVTAKILEETTLNQMLKQYQKILESTSVELEIYDKNGNLLNLNKSREKKCLVRLEERFADNIFVTPEILAGVSRKEHFILTQTFPCKRNDGKPDDIYFVEISIAPILDIHGELENIVVTLVDVTENISSAKNLDLLYKEQKEILETLPLGFVMYDSKGNIEYANPAYCELQGIENYETFIAQNLNLFEKKHIDQKLIDSIKAGESGDYNQTIDYDKLRINGTLETIQRGIKYHYVKYFPLRDDHNNIKSYILLINDITKDHKRKIDIEESNSKIKLAIKVSDLIQWDYDCDKDLISIIRFSGETKQIKFDEFLLYVYPEDLELVQNNMGFMRRREKRDINLVVRLKDELGSSKLSYFSITGTPLLYNEGGKVKSYTGFRRDNSLWYKLTEQIKSQNELNQIILDNVNSGLVYLDKYGKVIWENVSEKLPYNLTQGVKLFEVGKLCEESGCHINYPCDECVVKKVVSTRRIATCEKALRTGASLEVVGNPVYDEHGLVKGVVMKVENITIRKQLYNEVEESKNSAQESLQLLSEVIERIPSAIFLKDVNDDYKYILCNKKFTEISGFSSKEMIGKNDYDIYDEETANRFRKDDIRCTKSDDIIIVNSETNVNGVYRFWQTTKSKVKTVNGRELIVALGLDLSEIHETNKKLIVAKEKAEEADRLKSAFLANMSHEIRTPLNAIVGFSELIMSTNNEDEKKEYNKIISTNNELLLRLINDILDLSKLDAGTVELFPSEFNLHKYFKELEAIVKLRMTNDNVKLIVENPDEEFMVLLDRNRLTQIIMNFVTNAIKYTPNGHIRIGYKAQDGGVYFYVEDTGIGIAEDKKDKVFQRFEKLDQFAQGTGLGLSICKAFAEMNGGKIGFISQEGKGSTFWIWKPKGC